MSEKIEVQIDTDDDLKKAILKANSLGLRNMEVVELRLKRIFGKGSFIEFVTKHLGL